jgi:adenine phosphoribosyltransferase
MDLKKFVREVPDFPKKGILFYDITTLLKDKRALSHCIQELVSHYKNLGIHIDKVASMESRGFIFGPAIAVGLGAGFVPIRKPEKLPFKTLRHEYDLEYGKDILEVHHDAIDRNESVLIVDDLLATGGTAAAASSLIEKLGGKVQGACFVIELPTLGGRKKLENVDVHSLIQY